MLNLATAFDRNVDIGTPLPEVWPSLTRAGIRFRRSQVVMVAGQPGASKSTFALCLAAGLNIPTLYFSADTDDFTTSLRLAATLSGTAIDDIERDTKDPTVKEYYVDLLAQPDHLWWSFAPEPTPEMMDMELSAFAELYGAYPEIIIVDNLVNVTMEGENEWAAMRRIMKLLKYWAGHTGACILVLHHCREDADFDSRFCPPRSTIQGKLSQYPALILTVDTQPGLLKIACVKNRHGPYDRSGEHFISLNLDSARMQITEPERKEWLTLKGA